LLLFPVHMRHRTLTADSDPTLYLLVWLM